MKHIHFYSLLAAVLLMVCGSVMAANVDPGYYYLKTTEATYTPGAYLRATSSELPRVTSHSMPAVPTINEKAFIWKLEAMEGGKMSIRSIYDGRYLGGQIGTHGHHCTMSQAPHAMIFTYFEKYNDQVSDAWRIDCETDRDSGYGTAVRPGVTEWGEGGFLYFCDSFSGEVASWYLIPVDEEKSIELTTAELPYAGDDIEEGYYLVRSSEGNSSKPGVYLYCYPGDVYRTYQKAAPDLNVESLSEDDLAYVYKVKKMGGGYSFQNMMNDRYIGGAPSGNGHHVGAVTAPAPLRLNFNEEKGIYTIIDEQQPDNNFLPAYLNSGSEDFAWWAGGADWLMTSVEWNLIRLNSDMVEDVAYRTYTAVGTLDGANWVEDYKYTLKSQGNGIYTVEIKVTDAGDGYGFFCIYGSTSSGDTRSCYSSGSNDLELLPGVVETCAVYGDGYSWKVLPGTYVVTFDLKGGTIRINTPDAPDFITTRARAALESAISQAQDTWPGLDLTSVIAVLNDAAATDEQLAAAKNQIPALAVAYVRSQMNDATATAPVDATALITNADFAAKAGWTTEGGSVADNAFSAAGRAFTLTQTITDLPAGFYAVSVDAVSRYGAPAKFYAQAEMLGADKHNAYMTAASGEVENARSVWDIYDEIFMALDVKGEVDYSGEGWYTPSNVTSAKAYFVADRYTDNHVMVYVADGTLTIGARRQQAMDDDFFVADNWKLFYYGNDLSATKCMKDDLDKRFADIDDVPAEQALKDAYAAALATFVAVSDEAQLMDAYKALMEAVKALDDSQVAYAVFDSKLTAVMTVLEENPDINGTGVEFLIDYLTKDEAPGRFSNGSASYILDNGLLDAEGLAAEMQYVDDLLTNALKGGIAPGTDITPLFTNMNFDEKDWLGWTEQHTGEGSCSGYHGLPENPVAGWFNMDTAELSQSLEGVPNGIYAVSLNAFYRPGAPEICNSDSEIPAYGVVNGLKTPLLNVMSDALPESEAELDVNCHSSDYSTGDVRFPNAPNGASVAFAAGRYAQTVYGVVTDGTLTFGVRQEAIPAYDGDWFVVDNFRITYLGETLKAAQAMEDAQVERAETMLASTLTYSDVTRGMLIELMETNATDLESKIAKARQLDELCSKATTEGIAYTALETALATYQSTLENAAEYGRIDADAYQQAAAVVAQAWENLYGGNYTADEAWALAQELQQAALDLTPSIHSGYYYMMGSEYSTNYGKYLHVASSDIPFLATWNVPETPTLDDKQFIWKVDDLGDGTISIQSIYDGRYLGGQIGSYAHHGSMDTKVHAITPTYFSSFGGYSSEAWKLDAGLDKSSGYGTAMRPGTGGENIMLWYCDNQQGDAPAWVFQPVEASIAELLANTYPEYTGTEIEEGYYYVRSAATNDSKPNSYLYSYSGDNFRTYQSDTKADMSTELDTDHEIYAYYVKREKTGYSFCNYRSGKYIGGSPNSNGHHAGSVFTPAAFTLNYDETVGAYTILDESQHINNFLPAYLNSGSENFAWWAGGADWLMASIYWNLIPLTGVDGIQALPTDDDASEPVVIYTLDGRQVKDIDQPGIYIRRQGKDVKKILIR